MVATDSYRMAMRDLPDSHSSRASRICWCPPAPAELQRLPSGTVQRGPTHDTRSASPPAERNHVLAGNVQISTRLFEGRYPDYKQLIPDHYPNRLHLGQGDVFGGAAPGAAPGARQHAPVRLSMRQGGVDLSVVRVRRSETPPDRSMGTSAARTWSLRSIPSYLIDGVEAVAGDEVIVETADELCAATVRGAEDDAFRYLLMPVRVS